MHSIHLPANGRQFFPKSLDFTFQVVTLPSVDDPANIAGTQPVGKCPNALGPFHRRKSVIPHLAIDQLKGCGCRTGIGVAGSRCHAGQMPGYIVEQPLCSHHLDTRNNPSHFAH